MMHCYLEFKLHYFKNLKLFTIGVQKFLTPTIMQKKKKKKKEKSDGLLLFLKYTFKDNFLWAM